MGLYGHLDLVSADRIEGWAISRNNPARRRRVKILLDGMEIAEVAAGDFRKDLKLPSIGVGDGCYAFFHRLHAPAPGEHVVRVIDVETGHELDNSPAAFWVPCSVGQDAVPQAKSATASGLNSELEKIRQAGLHVVPASTVVFEGQPVSLGVLNCNPYHVTAIALTKSPALPLPLRVHINHQGIAETPFVSDSVAIDGQLACLYRFFVPSWFPVAPDMPVQLSLAGEPVLMPGREPRIECRFVGALDYCDSRTVSGWAICLDAVDQRVHIDILLGGRIIDSKSAARHRLELHGLGLGDGDYGFLLEFPESLEMPTGSDVVVRALVHGMGYELQYSPWYITRPPRARHMQELLAQANLPEPHRE